MNNVTNAYPPTPIRTALGCGLPLVILGHIGLAAALYIALCDVALGNCGVLWDVVAGGVSCAFVASGRHLLSSFE